MFLAMNLLCLRFSFKRGEVNYRLVDTRSNMMLSTVNPVSLSWSTHYHNVRYNCKVKAGLEA